MQKTQIFWDEIQFESQFPMTRPGFSKPPESAHLHNCFEIGFCHGGLGGVFQIGNKVYTCSPGDAVFINDREYHVLSQATPENSRWSFINLKPEELLMGWIPPEDPAFRTDRLSGPGFCNRFAESEAPELVGMTRLLFAEAEKMKPDQPVIRALVWGILGKLQKSAPVRPIGKGGNEQIELLYPALNYISNHYAEPLEVPELAVLCNMGLTTFRTRFVRCIRMRPLEYINTFRLKAAAALLKNTDRKIIDIAGQTGFVTLSQFNRLFREQFYCSPREYRAKITGRKPPQQTECCTDSCI